MNWRQKAWKDRALIPMDKFDEFFNPARNRFTVGLGNLDRQLRRMIEAVRDGERGGRGQAEMAFSDKEAGEYRGRILDDRLFISWNRTTFNLVDEPTAVQAAIEEHSRAFKDATGPKTTDDVVAHLKKYIRLIDEAEGR